jgi:dihydroorotate dehydrogenase electron transfer subunit|tara:strand:+ start:698 stop:1573 length:876 start_codon:yes stop_codon:yes gene_type:complete
MNDAQSQRGTIFIEEARIESLIAYPDQQFIMRLHSPKCAKKALPGSFVHIQCDKEILMRRPLSIMRVNANKGWIEILFKIIGNGLKALSEKKTGDILSSIGPIGNGFIPNKDKPKTILIGGGVGIPPIVFLAETLKQKKDFEPLVIMGSEIPFPFELIKRNIKIPWLENNINSSMPLLENWQLPCVLCSLSEIQGTFNGYVTQAADLYFSTLNQSELSKIEIFSCGPTPMLEAVSEVAKKYSLPCQISLEEYMACAIGGCAGCTIPIKTEDGIAMKRVCVDGPVFNANNVF